VKNLRSITEGKNLIIMAQTMTNQTNSHTWYSSILNEFRLERLIPSITAGFIVGILVIFVEISFAALIFSGSLSVYMPNGIGYLLLGSFIIGVIVSLTSSFSGMIALPQDSPTAIMALVAAAIAASMPATATSDNLFFTVVASIAVASILTGIFFLLLGTFKLGSLIRFIPYPVIGGFLAGTGWLLMKGAIGVMTDMTVCCTALPSFFQLSVITKWAPGVIFGIVLIVVSRRYHHFLVMPSMLASTIILFYVVLAFINVPVSEASAQGWLLGPFQESGLWRPLTISSLSHVQWPLIFQQTGSILSILIVSVISLLLNAGGVELSVRRDIDLNRELQCAGVSNLILGPCGCSPGFHAMSLSALGYKLGSDSRIVGLISALMCGAIFFFGASILGFFPKFVLGGLLFFLGLSFLSEWIYDSRATLPKPDYILVIVILGIVGTFGFLSGVIAGIFISVVLFVVKYSRINVVKHVLSGANFRSNVDRSMPHQTILKDKGDQLLIFKLQGFIFFGTAHNLMTQVRQRATDPDAPTLRYVIFDFKLVTGLDSSAINSFDKMKQVAEAQNIILMFVSLSPQIQQRFEIGGYKDEEGSVIRVFPDLDHGMEWCEEKIIETVKPSHAQDRKALLESSFEDIMKFLDKQEVFESIIIDLNPYLEQQTTEKGDYLIRQGDAPDSLYFLESGMITIQFEQEGGKATRLRTMHFGTVVGELGFYLEQPASASVVVCEAGTVYRLSTGSLQKMTEADPQLAVHFHDFMAKLLCEKLSTSNVLLRSLMD